MFADTRGQVSLRGRRGLYREKPQGWWRLRWLILAVFPVGTWLSIESYSDQIEVYATTNLVAFLAAAIVLRFGRRPEGGTIVGQSVLLIFVLGYYVKLYLAMCLRGPLTEALFPEYFLRIVNDDLLLRCLLVMSACSSAAAVGVLAAGHRWGKRSLQSEPGADEIAVPREGRVVSVTCVVVALGVVSTYCSYRLGYGVPGQGTALPYRLAGLINTTSWQVIPMLFTLLICVVSCCGRSKGIGWLTMLFVAYCGMQFLLFGGKRFLFLPVITVVLVRLAVGRWVVRKAYVAGAAAALVIMYPYLNPFRSARWSDTTLGVGQAITEATERGPRLAGVGGAVSVGGARLLSRVVGLDSLAPLIGARDGLWRNREWMDIALSPRGIGKILTHDILGIRFAMGVAPGLVGCAYFGSGSVIGTAFFVFVWVFFACRLASVLWERWGLLGRGLWVNWVIVAIQLTNEGVGLRRVMWFGFALMAAAVVGEWLTGESLPVQRRAFGPRQCRFATRASGGLRQESRRDGTGRGWEREHAGYNELSDAVPHR